LAREFVSSKPPLKYASDEQIWFGYRNGVWQPRKNAKPEIEAFLVAYQPTSLMRRPLLQVIGV